jgi:hypothetical protein
LTALKERSGIPFKHVVKMSDNRTMTLYGWLADDDGVAWGTLELNTAGEKLSSFRITRQ